MISAKLTIWDSLSKDLYRGLIQDDRWKLYIEGTGVTLLLAVVAVLMGIVIGVLVAIGKFYGSRRAAGPVWRAVAKVCDFYTTVIRGTPMVLQLLIIYSLTVWSKGTYACMIGFGINSGAYIAEIFRSGINSIDIGQTEAGRSLGLSEKTTMTRIVLPQAIKNVLPALFNEFIAMVKETSIAGYIAVRDITKVASSIKGTYFISSPLYIAAVIYLVMVLLLTRVQKRLERRLGRSDRG